MNLPKNLTSFFVFLAALMSLSACVTTRQQMNEEKGIREDDSSAPQAQKNSVKSEDLGSKAEPASSAPSQPAPPPTAGTAPALVGPVPLATPAPANTSSGGYTLEELRAEMARLNGKVEELEHEKQLREEARTEEQKKLQEKIADLEKQVKEQTPAAPTLPEGKTPFEAGKDAYFNEHYEEAINFLDKALQLKESGKEAEEAFYLQGESYYKLKNYQKAIVNYSKFPEKFPKSQYHSKALLRIAECFEAMGMKDDAKAFYQNLVDQFPKTAEGKLAKKRLGSKKK